MRGIFGFMTMKRMSIGFEADGAGVDHFNASEIYQALMPERRYGYTIIEVAIRRNGVTVVIGVDSSKNLEEFRQQASTDLGRVVADALKRGRANREAAEDWMKQAGIPEIVRKGIERRNKTLERVTRLEEAVERLLVWPALHEQEHPGWNGNRFDDVQFATELLEERNKT